MRLSNLTIERLRKAGWYEERKVDLKIVKDVFGKKGMKLFYVAEKFLEEFGMIEIKFNDPNLAFNIEESICFNPINAVGDCLDGEYFEDLELEFKDEIGEKVIPVGEVYRGNLILLITPKEKYFGYMD